MISALTKKENLYHRRRALRMTKQELVVEEQYRREQKEKIDKDRKVNLQIWYIYFDEITERDSNSEKNYTSWILQGFRDTVRYYSYHKLEEEIIAGEEKYFDETYRQTIEIFHETRLKLFALYAEVRSMGYVINLEEGELVQSERSNTIYNPSLKYLWKGEPKESISKSPLNADLKFYIEEATSQVLVDSLTLAIRNDHLDLEKKLREIIVGRLEGRTPVEVALTLSR